jgi:hypothetical protein
MSKVEARHIISAIQSLIDIDTFFEEWENVALWKEQLTEAQEIYKTLK